MLTKSPIQNQHVTLGNTTMFHRRQSRDHARDRRSAMVNKVLPYAAIVRKKVITMGRSVHKPKSARCAENCAGSRLVRITQQYQ